MDKELIDKVIAKLEEHGEEDLAERLLAEFSDSFDDDSEDEEDDGEAEDDGGDDDDAERDKSKGSSGNSEQIESRSKNVILAALSKRSKELGGL